MSADSSAETPDTVEPVAESDPTGDVDQALDELDALLSGASFEDPATDEPPPPKAEAPAPAKVAAPTAPTAASSDFSGAGIDLPQFDRVLQEAQVSGIDLLNDVNLDVRIELGRSRMLVEDVLRLVEGSVVELDKLAGDPVDVYVNERLVARGEVLVLNDNFCVRVNDIVQTPPEDDL
jgi:flagellar motor switch protein FliN/FliY